jgi:hypothetical protein
MADKKISALTSASTPLAGTEVLPIVQGGSTVKVAVSDLTAGRAVSVASLASAGAISGTTGGFTGALTVTNANIRVSNAYFHSAQNAAATIYINMIGRNSSDEVSIDPDGYKTRFGNTIFPNLDNASSCGQAANRWSVIYAGSATINTSDANQKEQIADLSDAEKRVAVKLKSLIKKFKFKDSVAKKGDAARWHVGVIAQDVEAAFASEQLNANDYGVFCRDEWWEKLVTDEIVNSETNETTQQENKSAVPYLATSQTEKEGWTKKIQLGVRYDGLFAFIVAVS